MISKWIKKHRKKRKFLSGLSKLSQTMERKRFGIDENNFKCFVDESTTHTNFDRHYLYHTAWAIRKLKETMPAIHEDISSSLYFAALGSAVTPIRFYDYRPAMLSLSGLETSRADLNNLPMTDNSVQSLSCMHVVKHVGLGRYGDEIDYDGDLKAIDELKRVLKPEGNLFFVVPIGAEAKIQFNSHRIYTYDQVVECFSDLELKEFSFIENEGDNTILLNYNPPH